MCFEFCRRREVGDDLSVFDELILWERELLSCLIEVLEENKQLDLEAVEESAQLRINVFAGYF